MANRADNGTDAYQLSDAESDTALALNAALDAGDMHSIMLILKEMARNRGMSTVAQEAGLGRESLYKSLRPTSKPGFATVLKVMQSLGLQIRTFPRHQK